MCSATATIKRCSWVSVDDPLMLEYHDREWGVPVHDDRKHFEFLVLEGAQAGLSWTIVLKKREGYRRAFDGFDPDKVARFSARRIEKLTLDSGIIRNRMKIESAVRNARAFLKIQEEFGSFDSYGWRFVHGRPKMNRWKNHAADSGDVTRIRCIQQGPQASRIQFRWSDGRVCPHAGRWNGKRPPRRLFPLSAGRIGRLYRPRNEEREKALKSDKFVISYRNTRVVISLAQGYRRQLGI